MFKNISILFLFNLLFATGHSQFQLPTYGFVSDIDILLDCSQKSFSKNKIAEIYFTEIIDSLDYRWPNRKKFALDTLFYGIQKNGHLQYELRQNIMMWPPSDSDLHKNDNGWQGYDTTFIKQGCKLSYYCDCLDSEYYDSIACDNDGRIVFTRQNYNHKIKYLYDSMKRLVEQQLRDDSPDGSSTYKGFYSYDKKNRLIEIRYAILGKSNKSPINDIFKDFDFDIRFKKILQYKDNGQVKSITYLYLDKSIKQFIPDFIVQYKYENNLLRQLISIDTKQKEVTYSESIGYKFYK